MELLENHIDEPIKKCVVGLNLLGIKTAMSCCGFTYKGEKVPKKHLDKVYIYIDKRKTEYQKFLLLFDLACVSQWTITPLNNVFIDFYANAWEKGHIWNDKDCPHYYEKFILAISSLEQAISKCKTLFLERATIEDGNSIYIDEFKIKHWQYEPAKSWVVTTETYENL